MVPPMLKQTGGLRRNLPGIRIWQGSPLIYVAAKLIDNWGGIVLLLLGGKTLSLVENEALLLIFSLAFPWLRYWRDEFCAAAALNNLLCRLALSIKLPVPHRVHVRRV